MGGLEYVMSLKERKRLVWYIKNKSNRSSSYYTSLHNDDDDDDEVILGIYAMTMRKRKGSCHQYTYI